MFGILLPAHRINKKLNIYFFNPYLHHDDDLNKNYFIFQFVDLKKIENKKMWIYYCKIKCKIREINLVNFGTKAKIYIFLLFISNNWKL